MKLIKERIQGYYNVLFALFFCLAFYGFFTSSSEYSPNHSKMYVDMGNKPIGKQDLLDYANHNRQYRKGEGSVEDFLKEAMLRQFTFAFDEISSELHRDRMRFFYSDKGFEEVYPSFLSLSYMKLIEKQEGYSEARFIGELKVEGETTTYPYEGSSILKPETNTYLVTGKLFVEVTGNETVNQFYDLRAYVQRALVEDKMRGYQVIRLELTQ